MKKTEMSNKVTFQCWNLKLGMHAEMEHFILKTEYNFEILKLIEPISSMFPFEKKAFQQKGDPFGGEDHLGDPGTI